VRGGLFTKTGFKEVNKSGKKAVKETSLIQIHKGFTKGECNKGY
jgi:hypothetical protein